MRFVPIKTDDQLDLQAIRRVRDRLVARRTSVINQIRAFLLERGLVFEKKPAKPLCGQNNLVLHGMVLRMSASHNYSPIGVKQPSCVAASDTLERRVSGLEENRVHSGGGAPYPYMAKKTNPRPKLGRPRKFDEDTALEAAMRVFWQKGYEGASLRALTDAMGLDRKSMYLTFGDKGSLFKKVLHRYSSTQLAFVPKAFAKPTLREFVDDLLNTAIRFWVDKRHPGTCMTIQNLAVSDEAEPIRQAMTEWRRWRLSTLVERIERARQEGDLPPQVKPETFARYLSVILAGLAVQASGGATLQDLKRSVAMFRQTMPISMETDSLGDRY